MIDKLPEILYIVHSGAHREYGAELLAQGRIRRANAQGTANQIFCRFLIIGVSHFTAFQAELLSLGRNAVWAQKRKVLQCETMGRDIPPLLYMAHIFIRTLRFDPNRDYKRLLP